MPPSRPARYSFQRALIVSIALHTCAAAFIVVGSLPIGSGTMHGGGRAFETTQISYLTIEHRARSRPRPARRVAVIPAAIPVVSRKTAAPKPVVRRAPLARSDALSSGPRAGSKRLTIPLMPATERPERRVAGGVPPSSAPALPSPSATVTPAPSPSASATATASPGPAKAGASEQLAARGLDVPPGGWGQSFERPLVADDAALETLRSHYHASAPVRVEVDETGRAIRVSLPPGLPDDVRAELERRLLDLRYVPAECNGLRCTGTLQLII